MKVDAISVSSSNLKQTVKFYSFLGLEVPEFKDDEEIGSRCRRALIGHIKKPKPEHACRH